MTQPRRAAYQPIDVTVDSAAKPRRGSGSAALLKRALAPAAVVGLLAATSALTFVPFGSGSTSVADPQAQSDVHLGVSRNSARAPLTGPTADPSPTLALSATSAPSTTAPAPSVSATTVSPTATTPALTPSATASASPSVPAKQAKLGEKVGVRYATSALNVRTGPGTDFDVIVSLADGKSLTITDQVFEGWQQVNLKGKVGWVKASYLTDDAPAAPKATATKSSNASDVTASKSDTTSGSSSETTSGSSSGGIDTSPCAKVEGIVGGLTSRTGKVARAVCNEFSGVSSFGGRRPGDDGYHGSGQAVDVMVSGDYGWQIARWARANAGSLGIIEVIYQQKIWTKQRSGDGWRSMSDRGSATANHNDHVHISVG